MIASWQSNKYNRPENSEMLHFSENIASSTTQSCVIEKNKFDYNHDPTNNIFLMFRFDLGGWKSDLLLLGKSLFGMELLGV